MMVKRITRRPRRYSDEPLAAVPPEEYLGPAMKALSLPLRQFVMELRDGPMGYGSEIRAARAAGLCRSDATDSQWRQMAHYAVHSDKVQEAMREVGGKLIRAAAYQSIRNVITIASDMAHRDCLKANQMLLDRGFPLQTEHKVTVEHVDRNKQSLEELQVLIRLGVTRDKLEATFGKDGLFHLEQQLDPKLIEATATK
jgi:hypothetical protein